MLALALLVSPLAAGEDTQILLQLMTFLDNAADYPFFSIVNIAIAVGVILHSIGFRGIYRISQEARYLYCILFSIIVCSFQLALVIITILNSGNPSFYHPVSNQLIPGAIPDYGMLRIAALISLAALSVMVGISVADMEYGSTSISSSRLTATIFILIGVTTFAVEIIVILYFFLASLFFFGIKVPKKSGFSEVQ